MSKMTEDEVFEQNLNGLPENYKLDPTKRRKHQVIKPEDATVQISLKIEGELLDRLKTAAKAKGLGYQTLLKQLVRSGLESEAKHLAVDGALQTQLEASMQIAVQALVQATLLAVTESRDPVLARKAKNA